MPKVSAVAASFAALLALALLPAVASAAGEYPLVFQNNTRGAFPDSKIYITGLGQTTPGQWSYLKPDGTMARLDHTMAQAPGHLTKRGQSYPNMSFTLAQAKTIQMPPEVQGGRIYISVGSPMYIGVSPDDSGWAGPNLRSTSDPNYDVIFDWYEYTYSYGAIPFGGNTTQVDQFAIPLTVRLQQTSSKTDIRNGITLRRKQVLARYRRAVAQPFRPLANRYRILAPRSAAVFDTGGAQSHYLDSAIDSAWGSWADGFSLTRLAQTFAGTTSGSTLTFTKDGAGPFTIEKPTTPDVFQCAGALASVGMSTTSLELGAELCAAFNRGVASDTKTWYTPKAYYRTTPANDYAAFFHAINIGHRSYAFAYDDVNDQSSVAILPNAQPPTRLTIVIGW